jgi:NADP-dependent 3-hydroxy acid dehydrogenase YdfG
MNKIIFITGASSGIGAAVSLKFAKEGWKVISAARNFKTLQKLKSNNTYKGSIVPVRIDITDQRMVRSKISYIIKKYGIPDIAFLNAGTNNPNSDKILSVEETKKIFDVNFFGTLNSLSEILPFMKKKKDSQIIIMSSVAGYRGLPYASAYCSSKSAIITFVESIFNQCKNIGIKVRLVNPGFIKTPLTDKNKFKMPFIISADIAAEMMYKKFLYSNSFEINLPWLFCLFMKTLRILPYKLYFKITQLLLKKL